MPGIQVLDRDLYIEELNKTPEFGPSYRGDAGIDLRAREDANVVAGASVKIPLGVAVAIPLGAVGWITGRSTSTLHMNLVVDEGKIDSGYRGEIHAFCTAQGSPVSVRRGDRIAQLLVLTIVPAELWEVCDVLPESDRGIRGLGSTGKR